MQLSALSRSNSRIFDRSGVRPAFLTTSPTHCQPCAVSPQRQVAGQDNPTRDPSDEALFERWRQGERAAGASLYRRHARRLRRFFSKRATNQAEDLVQQTFAACLEAQAAFRGDSSFWIYLRGLARLQLYMYYRRKRFQRALTCAWRVQQPSIGRGDALGTVDDVVLLRQALHRVPHDQLVALELAYWRGLNAAEIAQLLDVPENTVYSRLRRAKANLQQALVHRDACI
ncbi:MAG TPA: sigma-70 family RNA polymerase sigma factor [Polyangiales bacterium]